MTIVDWRAEVGIAFQLRRALSDRWPDVFPLTYPGIAASRESVATLGAAADEQLVSLLTTIDGWPAFFANVDLLSVEQLRGSSDLRAGTELLDVIYDEGPLDGWPQREGLNVIAAKQHTTDVFAVDLTGDVVDGGHPVHWFGGGALVDSYADLAEFFVSTHLYVRRRLAEGLPSAN